MSLIRVLGSRCFAAALLVCATAIFGFSQTPPAGLTVKSIDGAASWRPVNSDVRLRVAVTGADGQAAAGQAVLFVAPDQGPSGSLAAPGADPSGAILRVVTGPDGVAEAQLHTNGIAGPFLVSAWLEGTQQAIHFAISNAAFSSPPLDPDTAMASVRQQLQIDQSAAVYGPFLLDAGMAVSGAADPSSTNTPLQLAAPAVFFWIDDYPLASYDHPVRYVLLDSSNPTPKLNAPGVVLNRLWYPVVTSADGSASFALVAPLFRVRDIPAPTPTPMVEARLSARLFPRADDPSRTCVVIVYGPDSTAFENGAASMRSVFHDVLKIPDDNIIEDTVPGTFFGTNHQPSTPSRIRDLLNKAAGKNCAKLYFYFAGHGYDGGFCAANESNTDGSTEYDYVDFKDLANLFQQTKIPVICPILQSCHSGSAIPQMQNHGFSGEIATAAHKDKLAYHNPVPGFRDPYWTAQLAKTYQDLATLGPEQDLSLGNVALAVGEGLDPNSYTMIGNPRVATIDPAGGAAIAPAVVIVNIDDPSQNPAKFTVTVPPGFAKGAGLVEIKINFRSVAIGTDNLASGIDSQISRQQLPNGATTATFEVQGVSPGETDYTLTFTDSDAKTYTATGTIRVGDGYRVTPDPIGLHAGNSTILVIKRGKELANQPNPAKVTIAPADSASAAIASTDVTEVTFQPGADVQSFHVSGLKPGTASFRVIDGKAISTFTVLVDGLALNPAQLRLKAGETALVELSKQGPVLPIQSDSTITITGGGTIASTPDSQFTFPAPNRLKSFAVKGLAPGTTTFTIQSTDGATLTLPVTVDPASCPTSGIIDGIFTVFEDLDDSSSYVGLSSGRITFATTGKQIMFTGDRPQIVGATGVFDPMTCTWSATAISPNLIAGFADVQVMYINMKFGGADLNTLTGEYDVNTNKNFQNPAHPDGERPVKYKVTGTVTRK